MSEEKLERVNQYKIKGFDISLARHPEDRQRLFVVAVKDGQTLHLFAEPNHIAIEYVRKYHMQ